MKKSIIFFISTHTPLAGRDGWTAIYAGRIGIFLLTRPSRDVTYPARISKYFHRIFLLTRPSRDVTFFNGRQYKRLQFLLTRPSRDVTKRSAGMNIRLQFLLTRPSRDVTFGVVAVDDEDGISTHTPLAGRDGFWQGQRLHISRFLLTRPSRDVTIS